MLRLAALITLIGLLHLPIQTNAQSGTIALSPASPTNGDLVRARVSNLRTSFTCNLINPLRTRVAMSNNRITIVVIGDAPPVLCPVGTGPIDIILGQFPVGNYEVVVIEPSSANPPIPIGGPITFAVTEARPAYTSVWPWQPGPFPLDNVTGVWWNPNEPGQGLSIFEQPDGRVFGSWYTSDGSNDPTWYTLQDSTWDWSSSIASGTIYRTQSRYVSAPYFQSTQRVGSWALAFQPSSAGFGLNGAIFKFTVDGVSGQKNIQRFAF
jgi:hypothetical protein